MIQYQLRDDEEDWDSKPALVFITYVLGCEIAVCCAIYLGINLVFAIVLGFIVITLMLFMLKAVLENSYTTVTYLDEDDVERIRAQLNAKEKEGEA